jgi:hypothetical protein
MAVEGSLFIQMSFIFALIIIALLSKHNSFLALLSFLFGML